MKQYSHHQRSRPRVGRSCPTDPAGRRGSVLLIVLVIVMMLSLGAYTFSQLMVSEYEATVLHGRAIQTRAFADSGVELAATLLGNRTTTDNFYHDPATFQALMQTSEYPRDVGRFTIVAPVTGDPNRIRFGLLSESAKLNLKFAAEHEDLVLGREMLMGLPNMTEEIADAILDWVDEDDIAREFGIEPIDYADLDPTVAGRPIQSIEELLMVSGVTTFMLFGEDANRNSLLDANEDDGENPPWDNADGVLEMGWTYYLTLDSRENNLSVAGEEKIYVNQSDLKAMYDELAEVLEEEEAEFIVSFLAFGPSNLEEVESDLSTSASDAGLTASEAEALDKAANELAQALFSSSAGQDPVTQNGIDLSGGKQFTIESIYDLVDAEVEIEREGRSETITSPWTSAPADMQGYLPTLLDTITITEATVIRGRVDLNQGPLAVLLGIPEIDEQTAQGIADAQTIGEGGATTDLMTARATSAWIFIEGLVDLPELRRLDKYVTTTGDVYRAQVVGHYDDGGPQTRIEVVIDASEYPAKIVSSRDLSNLGTGYPQQLLQAPTQ